MTDARFDVIGVGAGPANLSLAALFEALAPQQIALFERQPGPDWHGGMLHAGVRMQTGWVKDLVSLVDPTHRLSFLNYLVSTGRVFAMLGAGFETVPRQEYTSYLAWAAARLPRVHYGVPIDRISYDGAFDCYSAGRLVATGTHLALGQGTVPHVPPFLRDLDPARVVVADDLGARLAELPGDPDTRIAVAGSGQTAAESVQLLLGAGYRNLAWLGRRPWFAPLEDSPAANDLYRPAYGEFFLGLSQPTRQRLVQEQVLTSDGITPGTLRAIYQANYEQYLRTGRHPVTVMPGRDLFATEPAGGDLVLRCRGLGTEERHRASYLIVALGRRYAPLPFDDDLAETVDFGEAGEALLEADYSVRWKYSDRNRIFMANRGRYSHGLADANLSLLPVRAATIINSLASQEVFRIRDDCPSTVWA
jgi:lysine N6-hydroxylase